MWSLTIRGIDMYHLVSWFFIYSFLGWLWETCYVSAKEGEWVNRGFINGPFCTIYGCGALAVYLVLYPFQENLLILYFGGVIVATALEYVTAVLMENIFHTSWWDYSDKKFNFQGRICLGASVGWGFFTVGLFKILHPAVEKIVALYPQRVGEIVIYVIVVVYAVDFCFSAAGLPFARSHSGMGAGSGADAGRTFAERQAEDGCLGRVYGGYKAGTERENILKAGLSGSTCGA